MDTPWKLLTQHQPNLLRETIGYLHHAAQLVAAVGNSLLPKEDDDSQSNLEWLPGINVLAGQLVEGGFRAALRYLPFELLVLDDQNRIREATDIQGQTKKFLMKWLKHAVSRTGGVGDKVKPISHFKIPAHPVAKGERFPEIVPAFHSELIHYRSNAGWILDEVGGLYKEVSPVRTWPHHFDTGAIITLESNSDGAPVKTVGIGWAIPDDQFDEPYFYVNHWKKSGQPDYDELPELDGAGEWYLETWKGAVLKSSQVVEHRKAADQQQETLQFFRYAIRAAKSILK